MVKIATGIAALLVGLAFALVIGLSAGYIIGALVLAAPIALAYDLIRRYLQRRGSKPC